MINPQVGKLYISHYGNEYMVFKIIDQPRGNYNGVCLGSSNVARGQKFWCTSSFKKPNWGWDTTKELDTDLEILLYSHS